LCNFPLVPNILFQWQNKNVGYFCYFLHVSHNCGEIFRHIVLFGFGTERIFPPFPKPRWTQFGISKLYCHVGFQDLLMNLAPVNSNGMIHVSSHPTPASQDPPSDPPSLTFAQYHSPLVNAYYGPNYTTLHSNTGQWTNSVSVHEPKYRSDCQSFLYCNLLSAEPKDYTLTMSLIKNTRFYEENMWLN
jgi:hypothetical protein